MDVDIEGLDIGLEKDLVAAIAADIVDRVEMAAEQHEWTIPAAASSGY